MSAQDFLASQGFKDSFNFDMNQSVPKEYTNIDSIWGKLGQGLGFVDRSSYDQWKTNQDRAYEREATNSARAWDLWMDSTATQRRVKDLEAAGLNPWLALQTGGISASGGTTTANQGSSARTKSDQKSGSMIQSVAMTLLASAKLIALLA